MRQHAALVVTAVLGGGTAVVFALALGASVLFPNGGMVSGGWNGGWGKGGMVVPQPAPVMVDDSSGGTAPAVAPDVAPEATPAAAEK